MLSLVGLAGFYLLKSNLMSIIHKKRAIKDLLIIISKYLHTLQLIVYNLMLTLQKRKKKEKSEHTTTLLVLTPLNILYFYMHE